MSFDLLGKKRKYSVKLVRQNPNGSFEFDINGRHRRATVLRKLPDGSIDLLVGHKAHHIKVGVDSGDEIVLLIDGRRTSFARRSNVRQPPLSSRAEVVEKSSQENAIVSTIPGRVIRVLVEPGMQVKKGTVVAVVESMKMEASIRSHRDGRVSEVKAEEGRGIQPGTVIALLD